MLEVRRLLEVPVLRRSGVLGVRCLLGVLEVRRLLGVLRRRRFGGAGGAGGLVVVATTAGGLKMTSSDELVPRGRGGQGVFIAKLADNDKIAAVAVVPGYAAVPGIQVGAEAAAAHNPGSAAGWHPGAKLIAIKPQDKDSRRIDPRPVELRFEPTKRYTKPIPQARRILQLAPARW